jgi:hypothetical protein
MSEPDGNPLLPEVVIAATDQRDPVGHQYEATDAAVRLDANVVAEVAVVADFQSFRRPESRAGANMEINAELAGRGATSAQAELRRQTPHAGE